ncbi:MAG: hypothetical protein HY819_07000 [Acidobacteria bacterium]|nr:hypothetical protein [Acidobacteriota bacterium]
MKKFGLLLTAVILVVVAVSFTQNVENSTPDKQKIKPITQLEKERISKEGSLNRGDTGRLTPEAFNQESEAIRTSSSMFVMEGIKSSSVSLPITGDRAKIGVFSAKDGSLDIELSDPQGQDVPVLPHTRNSQIPSHEMSQVVMGRGGVKDGVLLVTDRKVMTPGTYEVSVRQTKAPFDIIVNDEGGPVLNLWLNDNGRDSKTGVAVFAEIKDGETSVLGAQLVAKIKGTKTEVSLIETTPGVYSADLNVSNFEGIQTLIVEARARTSKGLDLLRNGSIDVIAGKSNAKILGIGQETLTGSDLVVEVNVKVTEAGRYYVKGNLLSNNNDPIAWAQDAQELTPGNHTLTLKFSREVLNTSGFSAGFKLSGVELMNTTNMPGIKAAEKIDNFFLKSSL